MIFSRQFRTSMSLNRVIGLMGILLVFGGFCGAAIIGAFTEEDLIDAGAQLIGLQIVLELAVVAEGECTGFFTDDEGDGIGLLRDAHACAVA